MTSLQKQAKPTPLQAFKDERIPLSEIHLTQGDYKFLYFFYRDLNNREPQLGVCLIPYPIYIYNIYEQRGLSHTGSTRMMCLDMSVEQDILTTLSKVTICKTEKNTLLFCDKDGKTVMKLEKR